MANPHQVSTARRLLVSNVLHSHVCYICKVYVSHQGLPGTAAGLSRVAGLCIRLAEPSPTSEPACMPGAAAAEGRRLHCRCRRIQLCLPACSRSSCNIKIMLAMPIIWACDKLRKVQALLYARDGGDKYVSSNILYLDTQQKEASPVGCRTPAKRQLHCGLGVANLLYGGGPSEFPPSAATQLSLVASAVVTTDCAAWQSRTGDQQAALLTARSACAQRLPAAEALHMIWFTIRKINRHYLILQDKAFSCKAL